MAMQAQQTSYSNLIEFFDEAKTVLTDKMKTEDDELSNLKFRLAAFIVRELSQNNPSDFQDYFIKTLAHCEHGGQEPDTSFLSREKAFHQITAAYLLELETTIDYVKRMLADLSGDAQREAFWKPIVADAFLIAGIYFAPSLGSFIRDRISYPEATTDPPQNRPALPLSSNI